VPCWVRTPESSMSICCLVLRHLLESTYLQASLLHMLRQPAWLPLVLPRLAALVLPMPAVQQAVRRVPALLELLVGLLSGVVAAVARQQKQQEEEVGQLASVPQQGPAAGGQELGQEGRQHGAMVEEAAEQHRQQQVAEVLQQQGLQRTLLHVLRTLAVGNAAAQRAIAQAPGAAAAAVALLGCGDSEVAGDAAAVSCVRCCTAGVRSAGSSCRRPPRV
jgi:hypothetical protein